MCEVLISLGRKLRSERLKLMSVNGWERIIVNNLQLAEVKKTNRPAGLSQQLIQSQRKKKRDHSFFFGISLVSPRKACLYDWCCINKAGMNVLISFGANIMIFNFLQNQ